MAGSQYVGLLLLAGLGLVAAQPSRIWTLATGHDWGAHEYFDTTGYLQGYVFHLVDAVCAEANMDCRMTWDRYTNCWKSDKNVHPSVGRGLFGRWYDGCMGWVPTVERIHSLTFSHNYLRETNSYFYVKKGESFNPSDLSGKTIGFLNGWVNDEKCLVRQSNIQNNRLSKDQITFVDNPSDVLKLALDGKVDAIFGADDYWTPDHRSKLDKIGTAYKCSLGGNGVMARKDSSFIPAWNVGFSKLKDSNKYSKLCSKYKQLHSAKGDIQCDL